jgi:hypothetical protein
MEKTRIVAAVRYAGQPAQCYAARDENFIAFRAEFA